MKKRTRFFRKFVYRIVEDYVTIHAAYTTLFLFMSFFPLIMFILNLMTLLGVDLSFLMAHIKNFIPEAFHGLVESIVHSVASSSSGIILSISVILAIWSSSSGIYGMMLGLNDVYRTYDTRNYLEKRSIAILYTLFFVVIVVITLVLLVFGRRISQFIGGKFPEWKWILNRVHDIKYPILFVVLVLFFNMVYTVLPHGVRGYFIQTPGSCFAAGGWLLFSYFYSLYVNRSESTSLYGSLATVCFFLLWMWFVNVIIFLGGEINASIHDHRHGEDTAEARMLGERRIREAEARLRQDHRLTAMERYNLRKTTTRQLELNRLLKEMQEEIELADQERLEREEREKPSDYSNS
ncbi:MAG: YihY/virulence factor BrkB family protein [Lachnospiraceae bacterium]|nr:YihY/virulence factor BrkB family protein [Lachnospiraceae bacterium]